MNVKLKFIKLGQTIPENYIALADSKCIKGYTYMISEEAYDVAADIYGGRSDSDEALDIDSSLWFAAFFDFDSFEEADKAVVDLLGGAQRAVAKLSLGSNISDSEWSEIFTTKTETVEEEDMVDDSELIYQMATGGAKTSVDEPISQSTPISPKEEPTSLAESASSVWGLDLLEESTSPEDSVPLEESTSPEDSVPLAESASSVWGLDLLEESTSPEDESMSREDAIDLMKFLRSESSMKREVFTRFTESVCFFARDTSVSDDVAESIYEGLLMGLEAALELDASSTLEFFNKIMKKYLGE